MAKLGSYQGGYSYHIDIIAKIIRRKASIIRGRLIFNHQWGCDIGKASYDRENIKIMLHRVYKMVDAYSNKLSLLEFLLLILIVVIPLWPEYLAIKLGLLPGVNIQRIIFIIVFFFWLATLLISFKFLINTLAFFKKISIVLLLAIFILQFLSISQSNSLLGSAFRLTEAFLFKFVLFLMILSIYKSHVQIFRLIKIMVITGFIVIIIAFIENILQYNLFQKLFSSQYQAFISKESLMLLQDDKYRDGAYRIKATFSTTLALVEYLFLIIPLAFILLFTQKKFFWKILALLVILGGVFALYQTHSRTVFLVLLVLISFYLSRHIISFFIRLKGNFLLVLPPLLFIFSLGIIMLITSILFIQYLLIDVDQKSTQSRFLQIEAASYLLIRSPLLGYGPGQSANTVNEFLDKKHIGIDNYYFLLALESGILAALLFIIIMVYFLYQSYTLSKTLDPPYAILATGLFYGLLAFTVCMGTMSIKPIFPILFIFFALVLLLKQINEQQISSNTNKLQ